MRKWHLGPSGAIGFALAASPVFLVAVGGVGAAGVPPASASRNPLTNPPANRPLPALASSTGQCTYAPGRAVRCQSPCFPVAKLVYNASPGCTRLLLAAVNEAQAAEHRPGFTLPSDYYRLSAARQLFVLVNLERISHGVPPLVGLSPYLDAAASAGARQAADPPSRFSYGPVKVWYPPQGGPLALGGAWAGNSVNAAAAVFGWFYDDGWGGKGHTSNFFCTSPTSSGCWGHRDELLGVWAGTACTDCVAGTGYASPAPHNWQQSYDFLVVRPMSFPTPLVFSWDGNVVPFLPKGWERATAP